MIAGLRRVLQSNERPGRNPLDRIFHCLRRTSRHRVARRAFSLHTNPVFHVLLALGCDIHPSLVVVLGHRPILANRQIPPRLQLHIAGNHRGLFNGLPPAGHR